MGESTFTDGSGQHSECAENGYDLSPYNTLAVPARCNELQRVSSIAELISAIKRVQNSQSPFLVLGEGSNTVFVGDYSGSVILNRLMGLDIVSETDSSVRVRVAAGENWHAFVSHCVQNKWHGVENLALIPGTVGAAPIQNIGAYGVEVKDTIAGVEVLDVETLNLENLPNSECGFAYRDSRFKQDWLNRKVVTAVTFELAKYPDAGADNASYLSLDYPALRDRVLTISDSTPTIRNVFDAVVAIRSEKLPSPSDIPNAGSFFKNPVVDMECYRRLKSEFPSLVAFEQAPNMKLAAAWLIDNAGWKEKEIDGVSVHSQQALVITNPHKKDGIAIERFASAIQHDIRQRYGVDLEIEPRLIYGSLSSI